MELLFPSRIGLKAHKCPTCGEALGRPVLDRSDATIRVVCLKAECGYAVDLVWIGDLSSSEN